MNKGIVMEMTGNRMIVMTSEGRFVQVLNKNPSYQIGDEIEFPTPVNRWKFSRFSLSSSVMAAVLLCIVIFFSIGVGGLGGGHVVAAYITLDINPSVELGIDALEEVIEVRALNNDGIEWLGSVQYEGMKLESVTSALMENLEQMGYWSEEPEAPRVILITSTIVQKNTDLDENVINEKVEMQVHKHMDKIVAKQENQPAITKLSVPQELRKEAMNEGMSTGKLAEKLIADDADELIEDKELVTKEDLTRLLKENKKIGKTSNKEKAAIKSKSNEDEVKNKDRDESSYLDDRAVIDNKKQEKREDKQEKKEKKKDKKEKQEKKERGKKEGEKEEKKQERKQEKQKTKEKTKEIKDKREKHDENNKNKKQRKD